MPTEQQVAQYGIDKMLKKRKKKDEGSPKPTLDVEGFGASPLVEKSVSASQRAANVVRAYYNSTGKLPSPEKAIAFTKATEKYPNMRPEDYDGLFPEWVKGMNDPRDIKLWEFAIDRVQRKLGENYAMPKKKEPKAVSFGGPDQALPKGSKPKQEAVTEPTPRSDYPANPAAERIRKEYADIRTSGDRASEFFYEDGTVDDASVAKHVRLHPRDNTVMDAAAITSLRKKYQGRDRAEMSDQERADIDALALKFADLYDESDGFSEMYGNDLDNVVWDKKFDKFAMRYVMMANLPYAVLKSKNDEDGSLKAKAMANISLATHGKVKNDDDLRDFFDMLGPLGEDGSPLKVQDQFAEFLFIGYANGRRDIWTDSRVLANYASEFGVEYLPPDQKAIYDEQHASWDRYMARADDILGMRTEKRIELAEDGDEQHSDEFDAILDAMIEDVTGVSATEGRGASSAEEVITLADIEPDKEPLDALFTQKGKALDAKTRDWVHVNLAPYVQDGLISFSDGIEYVDRKWDELLLTGDLIDRQREWEKRSLAAQSEGRDFDEPPPVAYQADRNPSFFTKLATMGNAESASLVSGAWETARTIRPESNRAFVDEMLENDGINSAEHRTLSFILDLGLSVMSGAIIEAGAMELGKVGMKSSAKIAAANASRTFSANYAAKMALKQVDADAALNAARGRAARYTRLAEQATDEKQKAKLLRQATQQENVGVRSAREAQARAQRPAWYDTMAAGLARGTQEPHQLVRILDIEEIPDQKLNTEMMGILKNIGKSSDPDYITTQLSVLRRPPYTQLLDPGTLWLRNNKRYMRAMTEEDSLANWRNKFDKGLRQERGAERIYATIEKVMRTTNGGFSAAEAQKTNEMLGRYLAQVDRISGKTWEEVYLKRQSLYGKMQDEIIANMKARPISDSQKKTIEKFAGIKGYSGKLSFENEWDVYESFRNVRNFNTAFQQQRNAPYYGESAVRVDNETGEVLGKEELKDPLFQVQLAKDLVDKFDVLDLASFQRGHLTTELLQETGLWGTGGPTFSGAVSAFRTLALARMGFVFQALLIDEAWRVPFEREFWTERVLRPLGHHQNWQKFMESGEVDRATTSALEHMIRGSAVMSPYNPEDKAYRTMFNGFIEQLSKRDPIVNDVLVKMERADGETTEQFTERFRKAVYDRIFDDSPAGEVLRLNLAQAQRGFKGGPYKTKDALKAEHESWVDTIGRTTDDYTAQKETREQLASEVEAAEAKVGKIPQKPSKQFVAAWNEYAKGRNLPQSQMASDWKRAVLRKRGVESDYDRLTELKSQLKQQRKAERDAYSRMHEAKNRSEPYLALDERANQWIDDIVDNVQPFLGDDTLMKALRNRSHVSSSQLRKSRANLRSQGLDLKPVAGVKPAPHTQPGHVPILDRYAEWGPYRLLQKGSNMAKQAAFADKFSYNYRLFKESGLDEEMAIARATRRAERQTNAIMYSPDKTVGENALRNVVYFLPAYRQAAVYWTRQLGKHPILMPMLWEKTNNDYLSVNVGGYKMGLPTPVWSTGNIEQMATPGLTAPWLLALRAVNTTTGWTQTEDGKYVYTGETKLDDLTKIPIAGAMLTFMNKNTSPLAFFDDLLWGVGHIHSPSEQDNVLGLVWDSGLTSLFRDPIKRQQTAMNISDSMMSNGVEPNLDKAISEMRKSPWWWKALSGEQVTAGDVVQNPDAMLAVITRQFFINRVTYTPDDLDQARKGDWADFMFGTEARTMVQADYEYTMAYGDAEKEEAVLDKYPKLRKKVDFYNLNAAERVEYLQDNPEIFPYVQGKNSYNDAGSLLMSGDYWTAKKNGYVYTMKRNDYLEKVDTRWKNLSWSKKMKMFESDKEAALREAKKFAVDWINKNSVSKEQREARLKEYELYYNGWLDTPADSKYDSYPQSIGWLENAAKDAGLADDIFRWNCAAIYMRFRDSVKSQETGAIRPETGQRPEDVGYNGIETTYTNEGVLTDEKRKDLLRVSEALLQTVPEKYKGLVDWHKSISYDLINEEAKKDQDRREYRIKQIAKGEWWKMSNPAASLRSIGVKVKDDYAINKAADDLDTLYFEYKKRLGSSVPTSREGKPIRAWYIESRDKILARPAAAQLQDGPAARLLATYLADPGGGRKVDKNYIRHAVAVMKKNNPEIGRLVYDWTGTGAGSFIGPKMDDRMQSATAWQSVLTVAIMYRRQMKNTWNESMDAPGISPSAKASSEYLRKLKLYAKIWSGSSERFAKEWKLLGGDDLVANMLDVGF